MSNYYCKYCGHKASTVQSLTFGYCTRHPDGSNKGRHALYEGGEKSQYTCKNCGSNFRNLVSLTSGYCTRHPDGSNKGRHQPAL
jgi:predicted nucleic acid-binding Zn ribbon protein